MAADISAAYYESTVLDVVSEDGVSATVTSSAAVSEIFLQTVAAKAIAGVFAFLSIVITCIQASLKLKWVNKCTI